jgi:hypothetical protein
MDSPGLPLIWGYVRCLVPSLQFREQGSLNICDVIYALLVRAVIVALFGKKPLLMSYRIGLRNCLATLSEKIREGTKWAQKGHKTRVLHGFLGSYMAAKSLYLLVTTGLTR